MPHYIYANKLAITSNLETGELLLRFMQETATIDFTSSLAGPFEIEDVASVVVTAKTANDLANIINNLMNGINTLPQEVHSEASAEPNDE